MSGSTSIPTGTTPNVANLKLMTYNDLVQRGTNVAQTVCPDLTDFSAGSPALAFVSVNAMGNLWLQYLVYSVFQQARFFTTTGKGVDTWANDFGFGRAAATYAIGTLTFGRYSANNVMMIPVGAVLQNDDGTIRVAVAPDTTNTYFDIGSNSYVVPPGIKSVVCLAQMVSSGNAGNIKAGVISRFYTSIAGPDYVTNETAFSGGSDGESDQDFKNRFIQFFNGRTGATPSAIVDAILSVNPNLTFQILENANGIQTDPITGLVTPQTQFGFFTVYIDAGGPTVVSDDLVGTVRDAINRVRALSVDFWVTQPTVVPVDVEYLLQYQPGYNKEYVRSLVNTAITNYVNSTPCGETLNYFRLAKIIDDIQGVKNIEFLIAAGFESNIESPPGGIIKIGELGGE